MVAGGKAQQERDPRPHLGQIDEAGGVIRLSPARSKTLVGRILPISQPIAEALARRRPRRDPDSPLVFHRDGIPVRLEFVVRPPLGAGPSPGSGRPNGHCSVRHGPPCGRRRRSTACGPSTTRGCGLRCRRPGSWQVSVQDHGHYRTVHGRDILAASFRSGAPRMGVTGAHEAQRRGPDGQVKQGEQEVLHARDSVGPTSGATQRGLKSGCSERIGNSRRTGARSSSAVRSSIG